MTKPAPPGIVLDAGYLVDTAAQPEFDARLAEHSRQLDASGLDLRVTGPWPPYSFVESARS